MSAGEDEPVEFYYVVDEPLEVLKHRLRTIYPSSFDIDRVQVNLVEKLLEPVEYRSDDVSNQLERGQRYDTEVDGTPTNQVGPIGTDGGTIRARPSIEDVTPYGVRWRGSVARRKDWMTTLTDFSERIERNHGQPEDDEHQSGRAPLAPLIDQLTEALQPMAFQVVFQRKPDWSRHARRPAGKLIAGTDTLLQKLLSIEWPGARRAHYGGTRRERGRRHRDGSRWGRQPVHQPRMRDRELDQKTETRLDHLRASSPKRTFTAYARLRRCSNLSD
jgi:hypothetical protein